MSTNAAHANEHERRGIQTSADAGAYKQAQMKPCTNERGRAGTSKNEREQLLAQTSGDRRGRGQSRTIERGQARTSGDKRGKQERAGAATSTNKRGQARTRTIKDNQARTSRDEWGKHE